MQQLTVTREQDVWHLEVTTPNNTVTPALLDSLTETLEEHERQPLARILILQGTGSRFFSPGFDLAQVSNFDRPRMADLIRRLERVCVALLCHPKPTLAMVNGDCLAGGFILASCCDFRIARKGARVGMTPMNLSITIPASAHRIVENRLGSRLTRSLVLTGRSFTVDDPEVSDWVDEIFESETQDSCLARWTANLSKSDAGAYRTSKHFLLQPLVGSLAPSDPRDVEAFLDCWFSPAARQRLESTLRRLSAG